MMLKSKSGSAYFERGSAVKISIQNDNGCSWVSGTVLRRFSSRRFLVVITDEQSRKRTRKFVSLHRLRPLLPRQIYLPKLKSGGDNRDCISELPDTVLLHIMSFMDTKDAVRTCVLSKRWKNLCKSLTCLAFSSVHRRKRGLKMCKKFASWVLTSRDSSHSLFNLTIDNWFYTEVVLLDRVMEYAMCHDVQHLTMLQLNSSSEKPFEIVTLSSISYCQTLTSLKLCFDENSTMIRLPKSLHLPALKSLHLQHIYFTADDNGCVEPFSNCNVLSTLFICNRYWLSDYVLCISNLTLSRLTLQGFEFRQNCQIVLSTPCLSSCNINGLRGLKLSSTCNLSFIEQVNIDMRGRSGSRIMSCLQLFVNVKILTLTPRTLYGILYEYFISPFRPAQPPHPPHFVRLESFKVENAKWPGRLSDWAVDKTLAYLLQNSQCPNRVVIHLATRRPQ